MRLITLLKMDSDSNRFCVMRVRRDKKTGMITMDAESWKTPEESARIARSARPYTAVRGNGFPIQSPLWGQPVRLRYVTRLDRCPRCGRIPVGKGGTGPTEKTA